LLFEYKTGSRQKPMNRMHQAQRAQLTAQLTAKLTAHSKAPHAHPLTHSPRTCPSGDQCSRDTATECMCDDTLAIGSASRASSDQSSLRHTLSSPTPDSESPVCAERRQVVRDASGECKWRDDAEDEWREIRQKRRQKMRRKMRRKTRGRFERKAEEDAEEGCARKMQVAHTQNGMP
jgi:hypothetical protein